MIEVCLKAPSHIMFMGYPCVHYYINGDIWGVYYGCHNDYKIEYHLNCTMNELKEIKIDGLTMEEIVKLLL